MTFVYLNFGLESTPANDAQQVCAAVSGNTLAGAAAHGGEDLYMKERFGVTTRLPGYAGASNDNTAVANFLSGQNTLTNSNILVKNNVSAGSGGYVRGAACP